MSYCVGSDMSCKDMILDSVSVANLDEVNLSDMVKSGVIFPEFTGLVSFLHLFPVPFWFQFQFPYPFPFPGAWQFSSCSFDSFSQLSLSSQHTSWNRWNCCGYGPMPLKYTHDKNHWTEYNIWFERWSSKNTKCLKIYFIKNPNWNFIMNVVFQLF